MKREKNGGEKRQDTFDKAACLQTDRPIDLLAAPDSYGCCVGQGTEQNQVRPGPSRDVRQHVEEDAVAR